MSGLLGNATESCNFRPVKLNGLFHPETFGKQVGGDIIENKKTFLYLRALEMATEDEARELRDLYSIKTRDPEAKVKRVTQIFRSSGSADAARERIREYTEDAFGQLQSLSLPEDRKAVLREFGEWLLNRNF